MSFPAALELIPHRQPMVFIDRVISCSDNDITAELDIRPELLFAEAAGLPSWTAIEIMAQTICALAGMKGRKQGQPPQIGYLLGSRRLTLPVPFFEFGETLTTHASEHYMHDNLGQFQCEIVYREQRISAVLSVYQPHTNEEEIA